jgi:acyl-[acyl-carrier-protein]-phospholipid O-acyltransferase/long-chain-fatty-acid--[acyl-carrier-protein] ligase
MDLSRLRPHLIASAAGAALDNLFRQVVTTSLVQVAMQRHAGGGAAAAQAREAAAKAYSAEALLVFSLPFILLAPLAGVLGDRLPKHRIMRAVRLVDIPVCCFGILGFWLGSPALLLTAMLGLAIASTIFAPVKLAVVPELVAPPQLSVANGRLAAVTVAAILLGTCLTALTDPGGLAAVLPAPTAASARRILADHPALPTAILAGLCAVICLAGILAAWRIPPLPARATGPDAHRWSLFAVVHQVAELWRMPGMIAPALALGGFWGLGAVAMAGLPPLAAGVYGLHAAGTVGLFLCLVIGIIAGSLAASRLTAPAFPAGLPIVGAAIAGTGFALLGICAEAASHRGADERSVAAVCAWLVVTGIGAGLWEVPLTVLLQERSSDGSRAAVLSATSAIGAISTAIGAGVFWLLSAPPAVLGLPGMSSARTLECLGLAVVAAAAFCAWCWRRHLAAYLMVLLVRTVWRTQVSGRELLPRQGGCVVACNHLSLADGLVVGASLPRPSRFLVYRRYTELPVLGWLLRTMGVIPVAAEDPRRALLAAIDAAIQAAKQGEVVVIFPEGKITRSGQMDAFHGGVERIAGRAGVPVVPAFLHGLYGGPFSRAEHRGLPRLGRRLALRLGAPLASGATAAEVRSRIMELSFEHASAAAARDHRTLAMAALSCARRRPRELAVRDASGQVSRARLLGAAQELRRLLALPPLERAVGILLPPGRAGALVNLALALAGRTAVNLNHTAGPAQVARMCELAGVTTIVSSRHYLEAIGAPTLPGRLLLVEDLLPRLAPWRVACATALNWLLPARWRAAGSAEDIAAIVFSSGSTGDPKGVQLNHRQVLANCRSVMDGLGLHLGEDAILSPLPLFHSFGLIPGMWLGLVHCLPVAAHPNPMDGKGLAELCVATKATFVLSTPTFVRGYLRVVEPEQFRTLRFAVVGAERCPPELKAKFKERFGCELLEGYGCTELAPVVSVNLPDHVVGKEVERRSREGSVGRALPGQHAFTVHPESQEPQPPGTEGLLVVRSPARMAGYLGREDLTVKAFIAGGYSTGDLGKVDADGFIHITGRLARFAKIGGEMVPLDTIEVHLQQAVGEAAEVAVAAVPDPARGERLVILHTGFTGSWDELIAGLEQLPPLWRPKSKDAYPVAAVPKLGTGKRDLAGIKRLALEKSAKPEKTA